MKLSRVTKNIIYMIGLAALVLILVGAIIFRSVEAFYFAFGVILTSALNVLKICMLERTVSNTLENDNVEAGKNKMRLQYLFRYFITAVVLLAIGLVNMFFDPPFINIWGAVAGIFTLQIAVIIVRNKKLDETD